MAPFHFKENSYKVYRDNHLWLVPTHNNYDLTKISSYCHHYESKHKETTQNYCNKAAKTKEYRFKTQAALSFLSFVSSCLMIPALCTNTKTMHNY